MTATMPDVAGLMALEERLRQDLAWLEWPAKSWVPRRHAFWYLSCCNVKYGGLAPSRDLGLTARMPRANGYFKVTRILAR